MRAALALVAWAALAGVAVVPAPARGGDGGPWFVPDHATLQLAGNVGFLSPGVGWAVGRKLESDVLLGWVPQGIGGDDIWSVTGKLTFAPWAVDAGRGWRVRPLTTAVQLTYTFGDQYFVVPGFAFTPTALRSGLAVGTDARTKLGGRTLGLYAELVALDLALGYWVGNPDAVGPTDVFSLALGARLVF